MAIIGMGTAQQIPLCGIQTAPNQHGGDFLHSRGRKFPRLAPETAKLCRPS